MKAINPKEIVEFISKEEKDLPQEEKTIFLVKFLTAYQNAKLRDELYDVTGAGKTRKETLKTGSADLKALKMGLKGWKNFKQDVDGKSVDIPFDGNDVESMLDLIPPNVRNELADFIRGESEANELE